ncbi:MAG: immunoglobulin domain-containing protein [Proteobacteria bacterium]|nr:immunoglobulin domain-containing protein [Pseudomonadota bacterium]
MMQNLIIDLILSDESVMIQVNFHFEISESSDDISFSLTCNSTGGQASSVVWTRDGFLLDNTNPLVVTDASTLSYSSVLVVSGRTAGTYTCTIRGTSDQDLGSANFIVQGRF